MNKILITLKAEESKVIVTLDGELDASTCLSVEKQFDKVLDEEAAAIYVNCSQLTYISSAGIGVLIALHHSCTKNNIPLFFCAMQPKVKNVLEILGLDRLFTIEPSLEKALEAVSLNKV